MRILVVGSGGREHAIAWRLKQSPSVSKVFCIPGNAGIAEDVTCINIATDDFEALADFALVESIDLTVVGPEVPLCNGITDFFKQKGLRVFGPGRHAAQLEGSKVYAKIFMDRYGIPTAPWASFETEVDCMHYIRRKFADGAKMLVVKADGLAAGKGVVVASSEAEALEAAQKCFDGAFGPTGVPVLIEDCLVGEEMSMLALTDGNVIVPLISAQDYKRLRDGAKGPNTGGMGSQSPAPQMNERNEALIRAQVLNPFLKGIQAEKMDYRGIIFIGLMMTEKGPEVLEFNVRFGDPETQSILARLKSDLGELFSMTEKGELEQAPLEWDDGCAVCVVMASGGYPEKYEKGVPIRGLERAEGVGLKVFHAGTALCNNEIVTSGGRVLGVTAVGATLQEATDRAYAGVRAIRFENAQFRHDIGAGERR